jgi:high-affinity iron transporter
MSTVWDTSWLLPQDTIVGRLLHTLIGYSDAPNGLQLISYAATIAVITLLMRWENGRQARLKAASVSAPLPAG